MDERLEDDAIEVESKLEEEKEESSDDDDDIPPNIEDEEDEVDDIAEGSKVPTTQIQLSGEPSSVEKKESMGSIAD